MGPRGDGSTKVYMTHLVIHLFIHPRRGSQIPLVGGIVPDARLRGTWMCALHHRAHILELVNDLHEGDSHWEGWFQNP